MGGRWFYTRGGPFLLNFGTISSLMYSKDEIKRRVGIYASALVRPGMVVGLGTGSTAYWVIMALGERMKKEGLVFTGVPTSKITASLCLDMGIPLLELNNVGTLDIDIDGADEIDAQLNLIKGGGGALLQEKMVAAASKQLIIIADYSKLVKQLGVFPLPVEVDPDCWKEVQKGINKTYKVAAILRDKDDLPFLTDHGHYILDCYFKVIDQAQELCADLNNIPGVIENGLFIKMAHKAIVGMPNGSIKQVSADYS